MRCSINAAARSGDKRLAAWTIAALSPLLIGSSGEDVQKGIDTRRILQLAQQGQ